MWWQRVVSAVVIAGLFGGLSFGQSSLDISGRVLDCSDSRPIPGASIRLDAAPISIIADADGSFFIFGLKAGTYSVDVEAPAYYTRSGFQLIVNEDFSADYTICLQPRIHYAGVQRVHAWTDTDRQSTVILKRNSPQFESAGSLAELVETIPDISVAYTGGKSGEAAVSVGGGPAKEVLVLVDGVSINSPITGVADINSIPLGNVTRVEFKRGSASSQFGAGAVGGVISVSTAASSEISDYGASGTVGSFKARSWQSRAGIPLTERAGVSGLYSGSTAANDFTFDDEKGSILRRKNADIRRTNAGLSAGAESGEGISLSSTYSFFCQQNGLPGFVHWLNPVARKDETRKIINVSLSADLGSHFHRAMYSYKDDSQAFQDTFMFSTVKTHGIYVDRLHQLNLETGFTMPRDSRIDLSITAAKERFATDNLLNPEQPMFDDVVEKRAAVAMSVVKGLTVSGARPRTAANIQLRLRSDYSDLYKPINSPSAHLGMSISGWFKVKGDASYGRSYRAPLYSSLFWNDGVMAVGNPNLQPERLEESSAGLGFSMPIMGNLGAEFVYRHSAYKDLIYWIQTFDNKFTPRNLSSSVVFSRTLSIHWALTPLNVTVSYSNLDQIARDRSWIRNHHDRLLPYRPRFTQHLAIRHSSRYLDLHYRLRDVSKRFIRAANTKWLDGYTVADINIALKCRIRSMGIRVQYDLDNITDSEYMLIERFPTPGRVWSFSIMLTFKPGIR